MATSADKLDIMLTVLSKHFAFDLAEAKNKLAEEKLLPNKLMNKPLFVSKKAEEFATEYHIDPSGVGTGNNGKWTIADLKKLVEPNLLISQTSFASKKAEEFASEHHIDPSGDGKGRNGKWTIADLKKLVKPKLLISPNARILATENGLSLSDKHGTGAGGRINLKDVQKWIIDGKTERESVSDSDSESGSDSDGESVDH